MDNSKKEQIIPGLMNSVARCNGVTAGSAYNKAQSRAKAIQQFMDMPMIQRSQGWERDIEDAVVFSSVRLRHARLAYHLFWGTKLSPTDICNTIDTLVESGLLSGGDADGTKAIIKKFVMDDVRARNKINN